MPGAPGQKVSVKTSSNRGSVIAVAALFFVNGFMFSNWLPRIPEVRDRLGVGNGGLGTALIGGGIGGLVASTLASRVFGRFNSRPVVTTAALSLAALLPFISLVPSPLSLMALLSALGFLDVFNDLAMNTQGMIVQERLGRSIMHRLHAGWSLGFTTGALFGSLASAAKLPMELHLSLVAAVLIVTVLTARPRLTPQDPRPDAERATGTNAPRTKFVISKVVVAMAIMAVGIGFLEVAPNDWSAVALRDLFHATRWQGIGAVVFASFMLLGRLGGDHVLERIGVRSLITTALGLSVAGAAVVVIARSMPVAVAGFALWGLGVSVMFPQLYTMAAKLPGTSAGAGLGAMAVGQRSGFLLTPVIVGQLSDWKGLRVAFTVIAAFAAMFVVTTRRIVAPSGT